MNKNPWNTNTILTLIGLVFLLVGIVAFYFVAGELPDRPIYLFTTFGIAAAIALVAIIYSILVAKGKITRFEPDYRQLFMMGIIFLPLGISSDNHAFLVFSLVFMGVGLANKKKWKKQPKLSELSPTQKKFRIALMLALGFLVLAGFVVWWWFGKYKF
jgi:hypothetical protein